jgi:putative GTP pyrophosphokinase
MAWIAPTNSRSRVDQAGRRVRSGTATFDDRQVIENWRLSHAYVLNAFQVVLRKRAGVDPNIAFAQRHKRRTTIEDKLIRQPTMALSRMHDIAGCRLIFPDTGSLYRYRSSLLQSRWQHENTNEVDDFDYIKKPKQDGYRGVHDVYRYAGRASSSEKWKGMRLELQYRTSVQHSWATAIEISDSMLQVGAKFGRAPEEHILFFKLVSDLFYWTIEPGCLTPSIYDINKVRSKVSELEHKTNIMNRLRGLNAARDHVAGYKHIVLEINTASRTLKIHKSPTLSKATALMLELENRSDLFSDIVLVSADSSQGLRSAFRNYFSDAREFIRNYDLAMKVGAHS